MSGPLDRVLCWLSNHPVVELSLALAAAVGVIVLALAVLL